MVILLLFILSFLFPKASFAAKIDSPTALLSASPSATPTGDNLDEIQKIRMAVQEKVKEKLNQIVKPDNSKKGYLGTISSLDANSLTISRNGSDKDINFDDSTAFIDINRKKIDSSKLKVGQSITALGYDNQQGSLDAKRVIINDPDYVPTKNTIVIGKIVDRSQTSNVALLIPSINKNNQYQITFSTSSTITSISGAKVTIKDITTGKKVIVVLTQDVKNKSASATNIIIVDSQK